MQLDAVICNSVSLLVLIGPAKKKVQDQSKASQHLILEGFGGFFKGSPKHFKRPCSFNEYPNYRSCAGVTVHQLPSYKVQGFFVL